MWRVGAGVPSGAVDGDSVPRDAPSPPDCFRLLCITILVSLFTDSSVGQSDTTFAIDLWFGFVVWLVRFGVCVTAILGGYC